MFQGTRLRQIRLARGYSLEELASETGGLITKQALSKYENDRSQPSPQIVHRLASIFAVKKSYFYESMAPKAEFIGYRRRSTLSKRSQGEIEARIQQELEERLALQRLKNEMGAQSLPIKEYQISKVEDAEVAAAKLREKWQLGQAPISNLIATMEEHGIQVILLPNMPDNFDGLSAFVKDPSSQTTIAVAIAKETEIGERLRFNLAHELGHLVMNIPAEMDSKTEEKAAHRFAAAFLAPAEKVRAEVGSKRRHIDDLELNLLKKRFGFSMQALVYRLKDLEIVSESFYQSWFTSISKRGLKATVIGDPIPVEEPEWLKRTVYQGLSEGWIAVSKAEQLLGKVKIEIEEPLLLRERKALMKLPLEDRRREMAKHSRVLALHYEQGNEEDEIVSNDLIE